ncbi:MAG TPA: DUF4136 domain-containing protein [Chthoniobacterales bacterium]|jgi:hypothetical protein|nr:DUF4136 domain-containing protein [Chthoniobacterales bacterium]
MKNIFNLLAVAGVTLLLSSCETVNVTTDYDHSAPFGNYRTYTLAPPPRGQSMSPTSEAALREALRSELAARGITEASGTKADLDVVRHAFIQGKISVQQYTDWGYARAGVWPYGYGYYGMWPGAPQTYTFYDEYNEGTLIVDFVDARTKKLVFRGVANAVVGGPEANAAKIREAVAKMMAGFPKSS